jgi:hypothetical protein
MVVNAGYKDRQDHAHPELAHNPITGEAFLGESRVTPVTGQVAILNYEVFGPRLGRWARAAQIPDDRLLLVNLRGRRDPLAHPDGRKRLAEVGEDQQVESLIVDPFGHAHPAANRDSSERELGRIVAALDEAWAVTLTGVGGVGKTRLALQAAPNRRPRSPSWRGSCPAPANR